MDDYLFKREVGRCKYVKEETKYLQICSFSDHKYDVIEERTLSLNQFSEIFAEQDTTCENHGKVPDHVKHLSSLRMILQPNCTNPDTLAPSTLSLPPEIYTQMITHFHLPPMGAETSSTVGFFFWSGWSTSEKAPNDHFQLIYRKANIQKWNSASGFELLLSYSPLASQTTVFFKGTSGHGILETILHLQASSSQISHPMLLPLLTFTHNHFSQIESRQRQARISLRRLEHALEFLSHEAKQDPVEDWSCYLDNDGLVDLDHINRDLSQLYRLVIMRGPTQQLPIIEGFENAMDQFDAGIKKQDSVSLGDVLRNRIRFLRNKLQGQENYQGTTIKRLEVLRSALPIACSQIDNRVNFQLASAQTKLAHSSQREAIAQKGLALLATVFLPGAYISSLLSTSFFSFPPSPGTHTSPLLFIYFAISIPLTLLTYLLWEARQDTDLSDPALVLLNMKRSSQKRAVSWKRDGDVELVATV